MTITIKKTIPNKTECLKEHFTFLDRLLWTNISIICQIDPSYVQKRIMYPIVNFINGEASGRRWFMKNKNEEMVYPVIDLINRWRDTGDWEESFHSFFKLQHYRDTIREIVEDFSCDDVRIQQYLRQNLDSYFKVRTKIVEAYLPLVWKFAGKYVKNPEVKQDVYQVGTMGIIHAIERYNNDGPMTFGPFAKRWIKQRILMYLNRQSHMIRVSHSVLEKNMKISKKELETGEVDDSEKSVKIKLVSASKDVILVENLDSEKLEEGEEHLFELDFLPKQMRQSLIIKYNLFHLAKPNCSNKSLKKEKKRQFAKLKGKQSAN